MKKPIVSVMIPTWNPNPEYLKQAIDSVLIQDLGPDAMQIAVVDDCSNQIDVKELLASWGYLSRIEWFQNEHNLGIGGAWNSCIKHSRGEWVHILHQDDVLEMGYYDILQHAQVVENQERLGFILTRNAYLTDKGLKKTFSIRYKEEIYVDESFYLTIHNLDLQCPGVLVPKRVYETVGYFREELQYSLDREMWTRIACKYAILYNPEPLCSFRVHGKSQSASLAESNNNRIEYANVIPLICSHLPDEVRNGIQVQMKKKITHSLLKNGDGLSLRKKIELCKLIWQKGYRPYLIKAFVS